MFSVRFMKGNKTVLESEFLTRNEAENFVYGYGSDYPHKYQVYDKTVVENEFRTQHEAENFVYGYNSDYPYEYQIYDKTHGILIDEGELDFSGKMEGDDLANYPK